MKMWLGAKGTLRTVHGREEHMVAERERKRLSHKSSLAQEIPITFAFENQRGIILQVLTITGA